MTNHEVAVGSELVGNAVRGVVSAVQRTLRKWKIICIARLQSGIDEFMSEEVRENQDRIGRIVIFRVGKVGADFIRLSDMDHLLSRGAPSTHYCQCFWSHL